jgi:hypothetical protein
VYAHPAAQLARLERIGLLHKVAVGYYVVVPQDRIGVGSNDLSLCAITTGLDDHGPGVSDRLCKCRGLAVVWDPDHAGLVKLENPDGTERGGCSGWPAGRRRGRSHR